MPVASQTITIQKGVAETVTIQLRPAENVAGWTLEFRAKGAATNPDTRTAAFLAGDVADDDDEIVVNTAKGFPVTGPYKVRIDDEVLQVTTGVDYYTESKVNLTWTVERGVWGTTAADHLKRARVSLFEVPQMLLDNGDNGGVTVEDEATGTIRLSFAALMTVERAAGTYWWNLRRIDSGFERTLAEGSIYLVPSTNSAFTEPPIHNL